MTVVNTTIRQTLEQRCFA